MSRSSKKTLTRRDDKHTEEHVANRIQTPRGCLGQVTHEPPQRPHRKVQRATDILYQAGTTAAELALDLRVAVARRRLKEP